MLLGLADAIGVAQQRTWLTVIAAVGFVLVMAGCEPESPQIPTVPPLTPAAAVTMPTATAAPSPSIPAPAAPTGLPPSGAVGARPAPDVPAEVVARTQERAAELTNRMLRARPVDIDVLWGALLTHRASGIGAGYAPDLDAPARMLEMWHSGNPCYETLQSEVERLGAQNHLGPVEFNAYFDHILDRMSACLDEQLPQLDGQQFFANPEAVRAERVLTWFDSIWNRSNGEALTELDHCREEFYGHMPAAVSAAEPAELHSAWGAAMVEFSECRQQALRAEFPFIYLGESQLFAFELNDRYTLVALRATLSGHLVAISMQRPYGACWPDFEARIPEVAVATRPAQLAESADAALRALRSCIENLPEYKPYAER